jgi:hypothetical protein
MPRTSQQDFLLSELAKVFNEVENLSKLSAFFFFLFGQSYFSRHLRSQKSQNFRTFFGYSVVKYQKNEKSGDF